MNAVERLWRALGQGDWPAMAAQLGAGARIERPGEASAEPPRTTSRGTAPPAHPTPSQRLRAVGDGTIVAHEATVERGGERFRVLALYDLHDGRVRGGTEVWDARAVRRRCAVASARRPVDVGQQVAAGR